MGGSAPVICVCGLAAEAKVARAAGFQAIVGAGDPRRTAALAGAAAREARCLVSFGIAGALAPHLRPGDVILSTEIVGDGRRWRAAASFAAEIAALGAQLGVVAGPVCGSRAILATPSDKRRLWRDTAALAVDLESAIVAEAAEAAGIPCVALRAIADAAGRLLPPAALIPLTAAGGPAVGRVLAEVLRHPRQIGALVALAGETRRALNALADPARGLHRGLAGPP